MQQDFEADSRKIVLLTTGGTIAGWAQDAARQGDYQAGVVSGSALLASLQPHLTSSLPIVLDEFEQINSKDATQDFWLRLHARISQHLAQADTAAVVVTHGTDTLEETSFFLSRTLPACTSRPSACNCSRMGVCECSCAGS